MIKILLYIGLVKLILVFHQSLQPQHDPGDNKPPKVLITKPAPNDRLPWNLIIPYSIHVNDPEDGNSEYDEIPSQEVLLVVNYLPNPAYAEEFINEGLDNIPEPLTMMSKSTCLLCHASKAKLIGPSFELIARKYDQDPGFTDDLTEKVIAGSTGTWGDLKMPPHPDVEIKHLKMMIHWILANGENPNQTFYVGIEGAFQTKEKQGSESGVYLLTAGYTDHGVNDIPKSAKQGKHTVAYPTE